MCAKTTKTRKKHKPNTEKTKRTNQMLSIDARCFFHERFTQIIHTVFDQTKAIRLRTCAKQNSEITGMRNKMQTSSGLSIRKRIFLPMLQRTHLSVSKRQRTLISYYLASFSKNVLVSSSDSGLILNEVSNFQENHEIKSCSRKSPTFPFVDGL